MSLRCKTHRNLKIESNSYMKINILQEKSILSICKLSHSIQRLPPIHLKNTALISLTIIVLKLGHLMVKDFMNKPSAPFPLKPTESLWTGLSVNVYGCVGCRYTALRPYSLITLLFSKSLCWAEIILYSTFSRILNTTLIIKLPIGIRYLEFILIHLCSLHAYCLDKFWNHYRDFSIYKI